ncbi:MAG: MlaD family protein [Mariprofundaceae bacterium]
MNGHAKLGAFVLTSLMLLVFASTQLNHISLFKDTPNHLFVQFDDLLGLELRAKVRMAGVQVGYVDEISLKQAKAVVRIALFEGVQLPSTTRASVASQSMLGQKYLALYATTDSQALLESGDLIPSDKSGDVTSMVSNFTGISENITTLMASLQQLLEKNDHPHSIPNLIAKTSQTVDSFSEIMHENRTQLRETLQSIHQSSDLLANKLPPLFTSMQESMQQLNASTRALPETIIAGKSLFEHSEKTMKSLNKVTDENRENLYRLIFKLRKSSEHLELLLDDLNRNPWKLLFKKSEVPPGPRVKQEKMEEELLDQERMGVSPALR